MYRLRKAPKRDAYWVVNIETGKKHSNDPLPKERAEAQMRALYAAEAGYEMRGGSETLPISLLQVLARAAYSGRTPLRVGGFELVRSSPTLKLYRRGNLIVVSVRGTDPLSARDVAADAASVAGRLRDSARYKDDVEFLRQFQAKNPMSKFRYIGVGHSLGGALIDLLLRDNLLTSALSFNPMVEPHERRVANPKHRRLYNDQDPLYLLFGKNVPNAEVRTPNDPLWLRWAKYKLPPGFRELFALYDAHRVQKFRGAGPIATAVKEDLPADPANQTAIQELESELRTLAHFYGYRDPALALGFRVIADEIHGVLPEYGVKPLPKTLARKLTKTHQNAQKFLTRSVLGTNDAVFDAGLTAPPPSARIAAEIAPLLPLTLTTQTDPANPMYGATRTSRYEIPPRTARQKEFLLQDYPEVKGTTMYLYANRTRL